MADKGSREGLTRRPSYRKSLSELTLPQQSLDLLEEKRKQLDESIHKYIAAKEREYKVFEKELKQQHRAAQGHDPTDGTAKRGSSPESTQVDGDATPLEAQKTSAVDALLLTAPRHGADTQALQADEDLSRRQDRSSMAGLKDRRASLERDKDFVGLFTPPYLPMLDDRDRRNLERTSSAPSAVQTLHKPDGQQNQDAIERASSDSMLQAKPKRPSQLALAHRTSSSGSSADGKLASAMKSPTQRPKRKRVSLAVGDSIVAPSDSVPVGLSHNSTPSHSRMRSSIVEREYSASAKESIEAKEEEQTSIETSLAIEEQVALANAAASREGRDLQEEASEATTTSQTVGAKPTPASSKIDPDGDLFDLEEDEDDIPDGQPDDDEFDSVIASEDDNTGRVDADSDGSEPDASDNRYDPETGLIPEPEDGKDSAVPNLAFGPGSSIASQQPTQPGFRRPSVVHDPVFRGQNYTAAEEDAVENEVYGSSYNRPSSKGSFTAGSLGESYMAQHAEEMIKLRSTRQQTQVRS